MGPQKLGLIELRRQRTGPEAPAPRLCGGMPQRPASRSPPPKAAASSLGSQLGAAAASFASHFKQFARPWQGEQLTKAEAEAKDSAISGQSPRRAGRR